jgi:putative FmdB family regulatory protein
MPIYNYKCRACGNEFQQLKKVDNRRMANCVCGGEADLKVSTFKGHLKGNNFTKKVIE